MKKFAKKSCKPASAETPRLTRKQIDAGLERLPGWEYRDGAICKIFSFRSFADTMAFVNGVAGIAAREDHHPEMRVSYSQCSIAYNTHSVGGMSENDFICAAKIEMLCAI
jgi:4a-hydroxytetrahydrobiopterin dehydratase